MRSILILLYPTGDLLYSEPSYRQYDLTIEGVVERSELNYQSHNMC